MRFMMFMLPNIDPADWMPSDAEAVAEMTRYNQSLQQAGVLLALDGLHSQSEGIRVEFASGKRTVTDGPFTEAKEMIGGYWLIDVKSKEEAVQSAVKFMELHKQYWPGWEGETEVRQMYAPGDFPCKP